MGDGRKERNSFMPNMPEYEALRREYLQGVVERAGQLRAGAEALRRGEDADLRALRQEVHKLRGSGGFYGYRSLSEAAGRAEDALNLVLDGELPRNDAQLADLLDQVIAEIEAAAK
ncbi:chemotaxis protein histidine kinase CheA [Symbiobacterium terraclitae]|uniref:Chemotaxis protein histidine kinase CheA n=1 Tax=Symbiobacterium terraclitae TaxID=557451 RepID=A0ABS4JRZ4_9FIRM|nr:chemotaxis protein histidine kinase CheA [Symbiobacterium terraclitae]